MLDHSDRQSQNRAAGEAEAISLMRDLRLPSTNSDVGIIAQVIRLESQDHAGDLKRTADCLRDLAFAAQKRGEVVNRFFFQDRRFALQALCGGISIEGWK
jgi:hypothetical protein